MQSINEDEQNGELQKLQELIYTKIVTIRDIITDQDKWVAEEIALRKNNSNQLLYPKFDKKVCYYQQFWKVYLMNEIMISKIKQYSLVNKTVSADITQLQQAQKEWSQIWSQKAKKKARRPSILIDKNYTCPFSNCDKIYGSDVSLNLHMKLKHNSGTKTERQILARQICIGEQNNKKVEITLVFPPGYLQKFRETFKKQQ